MNREQLRSLARELKGMGVKEAFGYSLSTDLSKHDLECDLADCIREIHIAGRAAEFEKALTKGQAKEAWKELSSAMQALKKEEPLADKQFEDKGKKLESKLSAGLICPRCKDTSPPSSEFCETCGTELSELPLGGGSDKTIEQVAAEVLNPKPKKQPKPEGTRGRAKKGETWAWAESRFTKEACKESPPTRAQLLFELEKLFPHLCEKSRINFLAGLKKWKWTKLDFICSEDESGLFKVSERKAS